MSYINGKRSIYWIEENHPENGLFRVYWKNVIEITEYNYLRYRDSLSGARCIGEATLDSEEGEGLRWEWYYKDGKRADGVSKGWYPNGQIKFEWTWKDGRLNGPFIDWFETGIISEEGTYKNLSGYFLTADKDGVYKGYDPAGRMILEENYKNNKLDGESKYWNMDGYCDSLYYKDGKLIEE